MKFSKKEVIVDVIKKEDYHEFILVGDVGGTNTTLAVFGARARKLEMLLWYSVDSKKIVHVYDALNGAMADAFEKHGIEIGRAAVAAAGAINDGVCKLTNIKLVIDTNEVLHNTMLKSFCVINDFQAVGYGIEQIQTAPNSLRVLQDGQMQDRGVRAVIGAGTGLGKGVLVYDTGKHHYSVLPSEGGHVTFSAANKEEHSLAMYVKRRAKAEQVEVEHLVSGSGIEHIYKFLTKKSKSSEEIADSYKKDSKAKKAFDLFVTLYARAAKNLCLNVLPYGGLYIAGGIAKKNIGIFSKKVFLDEFLTSRQKELLEKIPIHVILNRDVALYGAANYLINFAR